MPQLDFLTDSEIGDLTKKKRKSAQYRCLIRMGIPCSQRPDRSIVVLRAHAMKKLGTIEASQKRNEPNWSALRG